MVSGEAVVMQATEPADDLAAKSNLTRSQYLMWLGQKLNPQVPLYNMIQTFTIEGELQPARFERALQALIASSDALRTAIDEVDGVPQQRVLTTVPVALEFLDFSALPDPEPAYRRWVDERSVRLFDLNKPLFDTALMKLGASRCVWYLNQHHLITDGWSGVVVFKRLADFYTEDEGGLNDVPLLPQYADYVDYERANRESSAFQKANAYWQDRVATPSEPLVFYESAVPKRTARTERIVYDLGLERSQKLKTIAGEKDVQGFSLDLTLFNIFVMIVNAFVHRVSGSQDIVIGTPFHNRPTAAFKDTVGLFIEIGPQRVTVTEEDTFISLLRIVNRETMTGLRFVQPGISSAALNRSYEVLLNYINVSFPDFAGMPVKVDWLHGGYGDSNHSFRLQVHDFDAAGSFMLHFDFNCNIFDEERRERAIRHFLQLVDVFIEDRYQLIGKVSLLSEQERQQKLVSFNQTTRPYPSESTIVTLFEQQVNRTPNAVAVEHDGQRLTYAELNTRANQLAHLMRGYGVGADTLVPIVMEHSLEVVVTILGILKAGGAYVPVDPAYPKERLAFMLDDIAHSVQGIKLAAITQPHLSHLLPENVTVISLDNTWQAIENQPTSNPVSTITPDNLAYAIYTSGSTGKPKGTLIEYRGLVNYIWWAKNYYQQGETLDFPLFSSLSFDLTVTSIFVPLTSGGRIVVYREDDGSRGMSILKVIEDNKVDIIKLTPAHLSLIKNMNLGVTRIRKFIVGGEDFKTELAKTISDAFGGQVDIYNEYGPTETVVGCMIHWFDPAADTLPSVPIGTPVDNAQIYVLDTYLNPVTTGIVGEMYIGGDGVARGYLNRPDLTAERFIPNPFKPGERMYKTGDLARWLPTGRLEFLGRADHQVKIGGARIELAEIEARLLAHPDIRECVADVFQFKQDSDSQSLIYCTRCGIASNYPGVQYDADGVCSLCRAYDSYKAKAQQYFRTMDELYHLVEQVKTARTGDYDCLALYSGGKDSTYMLYQLAGMGLKILAFTLDNGYISEQAKGNILRVVQSLGIDHVFGSTPFMRDIFADSLKHYSNVCNGCFKTIYTLAVNAARERGIGYIFTGLSRGQFFETRLTEDLFRQKDFNIQAIEDAVMQARKAYHRRDDLISRSLDVDVFRNDSLFEDIQFIDFYRYCAVELDDVYTFLNQRAPWLRPSDTGRSTNCLINDVGIFVHQQERGYHNYALPYSWDVRLGHKQRDDALDELNDSIDENYVQQILREINYQPRYTHHDQNSKRLVAYYVSDCLLTTSELRAHLSETLPVYMIPSHFVRVEQMPLNRNGKVDRAALPRPQIERPDLDSDYVAPSTSVELRLAEFWAEALGVPQIGIHDDFFELGGSSLPAIQIVARTSRAYAIDLPLPRFFENPTIAGMAAAVEELLIIQLENLSDEDAERLLAQLQ